MSIEITILLAVLSFAIAAAGFFSGKSANAKQEGEWKGTLNTKLENLTNTVKDVKEVIQTNDQRTQSTLDSLKEANKNSFERIHMRIDEVDSKVDLKMENHVKDYHKSH